MHNMLGNWDVNNNQTVGNAGKSSPRMLDSFADQRDGSDSWGISVQRQPAEEGGGGLINQHDSAVNLGITSVADVDEREPTGICTTTRSTGTTARATSATLCTV